MRKAIQLKATFWTECEDEPAHDFAKFTKQAVRDIISAGQARYPGLYVTIKKIDEDTSDSDNGTD